MSTDFFAGKAARFDQNPARVDNVQNIADGILARFALNREQRLMDFGAGTGLLLERIAPHVGHITAVDVSPSMNAQLAAKRDGLPCVLEIVPVNLAEAGASQHFPHLFDGIISSMTLHHIADIDGIFCTLHRLLCPGGFVAMADLEAEDGSFHSEDTGVFHHGFEPATLAAAAARAGFVDIVTSRVSVIHKPQGDFPVFLLTARRQAV